MQEVDDVYPQSVSHEEQVRQLHLVPGFHALDRGPVDAGGVGEGLLSHRLVEASHADAVADGAAGRVTNSGSSAGTRPTVYGS